MVAAVTRAGSACSIEQCRMHHSMWATGRSVTAQKSGSSGINSSKLAQRDPLQVLWPVVAKPLAGDCGLGLAAASGQPGMEPPQPDVLSCRPPPSTSWPMIGTRPSWAHLGMRS
jgi:hypothetical protein